MDWNYRVVYHREAGHDIYFIAEVFYNKEGQIVAYTEIANECLGSWPGGDSVKELEADLDRMLSACRKPVLLLSDLKKIRGE